MQGGVDGVADFICGIGDKAAYRKKAAKDYGVVERHFCSRFVPGLFGRHNRGRRQDYIRSDIA
jgi:hypothetical protein